MVETSLEVGNFGGGKDFGVYLDDLDMAKRKVVL